MNSNRTDFDIDLNFLEARAAIKKLQQLSFNSSEFEKRYPFSTMTIQQKEQLLGFYLAIRLDLQEIIEDLERIRKHFSEGVTYER